MAEGGSTEFHALPTEECKRHPTKIVDMYCGDDDIVGCSVCFHLDHKFCEDIYYIPEYVALNFPSEQVNQINEELTETIKTMEELKKQHDKLDDNLDKSRASCQHGVQQYRDEINHIIDKTDEATLAELDARHNDMKTKTDKKRREIQYELDKMVRRKDEIESDQTNDAQKFVTAKLSQPTLRKSQIFQSELSNDQTTELEFTRNTDIKTFLMSSVTLGMLRTTSSTELTQTKSLIHLKQSLFKVVDRSEYNIREPDDENTCGIWPSCILDSDNILLVDYRNKKLKLVDSRTYTIRSSLAFDARRRVLFKVSPVSVRRVSSTEAEVCLDNKTKQLVSTKAGIIESIDSLNMAHDCNCISSIRDRMYVCSCVSVYIYTSTGTLEHTITKNRWGTNIFSYIRDSTSSDIKR